jgi:hypothetical protein
MGPPGRGGRARTPGKSFQVNGGKVERPGDSDATDARPARADARPARTPAPAGPCEGPIPLLVVAVWDSVEEDRGQNGQGG